MLNAVIDGGQLTGARVVELLAELRQLEEREMAELLPMEEATARNPTLNSNPLALPLSLPLPQPQNSDPNPNPSRLPEAPTLAPTPTLLLPLGDRA